MAVTTTIFTNKGNTGNQYSATYANAASAFLIDVWGTFAGATVYIAVSTDNGTTFRKYKGTDMTAQTCGSVPIPPGLPWRLEISGAGASTSINANYAV